MRHDDAPLVAGGAVEEAPFTWFHHTQTHP